MTTNTLQKGVTFVTALYLPSTPLYKQVNTYIAHFERLASTGVPIILFMDERLKEQGEVLCSSFPNIQHCIYGLLDRRWISENNVLPNVRNLQKDSADYFCIQLSKLKVLSEAAPLATTTHLAWIDFGIFHVFQDKHLCHYWLNKIAYSHFPTTSIFVPGCWPMGSYDIWNAICWRFCGGFLLGAKDLFEPAYQEQTRLILQHLPRLTWEVNYWVLMEQHFTYYDADHNESLLAKVCHYTCP
jgi:hypothetical protein